MRKLTKDERKIIRKAINAVARREEFTCHAINVSAGVDKHIDTNLLSLYRKFYSQTSKFGFHFTDPDPALNNSNVLLLPGACPITHNIRVLMLLTFLEVCS